jgi:predicted esterase
MVVAMLVPPPWFFPLLLACALVLAPRNSRADEAATATKTSPSWCGPSSESVGENVCYLDGGARTAPRRTLVVWLHGMIAKNTNWSHNHQKMVLRVAKYHGVDVIFPQAPSTDGGYIWPGTLASQQKVEQGLIDGWAAARKSLETRDGRPYDEVFVMGFSSGAYFASSLAMRGRMDVDGYAMFAGGQPMPAAAAPVERFAPVFVGVCADDATTAAHSRAFASSLAAAGISRAVSEQHVGHGLSEVHFASALSFLRRAGKARLAMR